MIWLCEGVMVIHNATWGVARGNKLRRHHYQGSRWRVFSMCIIFSSRERDNDGFLAFFINIKEERWMSPAQNSSVSLAADMATFEVPQKCIENRWRINFVKRQEIEAIQAIRAYMGRIRLRGSVEWPCLHFLLNSSSSNPCDFDAIVAPPIGLSEFGWRSGQQASHCVCVVNRVEVGDMFPRWPTFSPPYITAVNKRIYSTVIVSTLQAPRIVSDQLRASLIHAFCYNFNEFASRQVPVLCKRA